MKPWVNNDKQLLKQLRHAGAAADTTSGSTSQLHKEKTPQSAPTVSVDEDETQDPSGGMEG